ncbi:g2493 [Coccomyxa elongata]
MEIPTPDASAPKTSSYRGTIRLEAAQNLLGILRLAVETRKTALLDLSLDLIQKLIAHQHLAGAVHSISHKREPAAARTGRKRPSEEDDLGDHGDHGDAGDMPPQAQAIELLCRCDDIPDDGVELRVLKGLLTAATSSTLHLHGQALLLTVRTCYNIFLMSRSTVNQTTAKASLTQMLNCVFQRMELNSEVVHVQPIAVVDMLGLPSTETDTTFVQNFLHEVVTAVDPFGYYAEGIQQGLDDAFKTKLTTSSPYGYHTPPDGSPSAGPRPVSAPRPSIRSSEDTSLPKDRPFSAPPVPDAAPGETGINAEAAPDSNGASVAPVPETTQSEGAQAAESKAAEEEGGAEASEEQEAGSSPLVAGKGVESHPVVITRPATAEPFNSRPATAEQDGEMSIVLAKDAFLVFRALCKLSIRSSNESASGLDPPAIRGKVLALELLKVLLENSGKVFQASEKFTGAIKQYLCLSLLKNASSPIPAAQALTCSIFYTLLAKFRHALKAEVGVFFPMILLHAIEPPAQSATPGPPGQGSAGAGGEAGQRAVALRCLAGACESGQLLVDIFVNYDCDLEGANLFERLVLALVRTAQAAPSASDAPAAAADEAHLRLLALQCLVSILRSLVEWYTVSTPVVAANDSTSAFDQSMRSDWGTLTSVAGQDPSSEAAEGDAAPAADSEVPVPESPTAMRRESALAAFKSAGGGERLMSISNMDPELQAALANADSAPEAQLLESWKAYKKGFQQGIALFNAKPKKGIAFLQEQGMLGRLPEDVAKFLAKTAGLNKTMIGEYLGEREETCLRVMHSYVDAMDFTGSEFDTAIRTFLSGFRLPGEAQKIDRLMEKFAERYVSCNPDAFKSADVAYVLAYSVILLNTDAHNPQVKNKMSKQDFLKNNRGINDGADLPEDDMSELYDRILNNEIKMKDADAEGLVATNTAKGGGWMDTILNLIPGRRAAASNEPSEEAIRRTHDNLREKAKGAMFFEATEGETVRPMLDVAWAPMLGAFSVLFEEFSEGTTVNLCLAGLVAAVRVTSLLSMDMLRNTFVTTVARFTQLHSPASMALKNAQAFRALLVIADENGNHLGNVWQEVLRCVSRWELLQQIASGGPSDALLFAAPAEPVAAVKKRNFFSRAPKDGANGKVTDSFTSIHDAPLHWSGRGHGKDGANDSGLPPENVLQEIDAQELNRMFVRSGLLDSEAIVEFVRALCHVAQEELRPTAAPRVYSLTKIIEISHFNMSRIRLVWNRIWAVLSDFFVEVGCHKNLQVAMYSVDSLRQLATKFLERDELANYSFQNDFLKPFVIVMRLSKALEIRELIIRCVSQMVLARVSNVKSGWKSMFMVFTTAANDESPMIVRLAFDTVEKIVREHFDYITETEVTTFTDCVNCLIAFTNNPHSLDVSLNAIAFLRFCAMKLAEGAIGDVEVLPEGSHTLLPDLNQHRIRPSKNEPDAYSTPSTSRRVTFEGLEAPVADEEVAARGGPAEGQEVQGEEAAQAAAILEDGSKGKGLQFSDKDEHMYFWFPLLAGLSELTFDPRPDIRYSALEVLFDTLKYHGASFTAPFWARVFDSVLLPIFDHVRAEVTDTTTFTAEERRAEVDAWLYETCTQCLQHMVDIIALFYTPVAPILPRIFDLLSNFVRRPHQSLAAVGVAALVRLIVAAGDRMSAAVWVEAIGTLAACATDTRPAVRELVAAVRMSSDSGGIQPPASPSPATPAAAAPEDSPWSAKSPGDSPRGAAVPARSDSISGERRQVSLSSGSGARRLAEARCRAAIQLLLVQACGEVYASHAPRLPQAAAILMLDALAAVAEHARDIDADLDLRRSLAAAQAAGKVPEGKLLSDPPLLRLEGEACHAYLSMLLHLNSAGSEPLRQAAGVEQRLLALCIANLECFEATEGDAGRDSGSGSGLVGVREEAGARGPLVVATLKALGALSDDTFRRHLVTIFPRLTRLIACIRAPPEIQRALSDLFARRIGPLLTLG